MKPPHRRLHPALPGALLALLSMPLLASPASRGPWAQDPAPDAPPAAAAPRDEPAPEATAMLERLGTRLVGGEWHAGEGAPREAFHVFEWGPSHRLLTLRTHDEANLAQRPGTSLFYAVEGEPSVRAVAAGHEGSFVQGTLTFEGDELRMPFTWVTGGRTFEFVDRWVFDGPDAYRWTLLSKQGENLAEVMGCTFTRQREATPLPDEVATDESAPTHLAPLAFLAEHGWDGVASMGGGAELRTTNTFRFEFGHHQLVGEARSAAADGGDGLLERSYYFHDPVADALRVLGFGPDGLVMTGTLHEDEGSLRMELEVPGPAPLRFRERIVRAESGVLTARLWAVPAEGELDEAAASPLFTATYTPRP